MTHSLMLYMYIIHNWAVPHGMCVRVCVVSSLSSFSLFLLAMQIFTAISWHSVFICFDDQRPLRQREVNRHGSIIYTCACTCILSLYVQCVCVPLHSFACVLCVAALSFIVFVFEFLCVHVSVRALNVCLCVWTIVWSSCVSVCVCVCVCLVLCCVIM